MRCSNCGAENRSGAKFCNECAAPMPVSCPQCGAGNRAGAKFCDECAAPLSPLHPHPRPEVEPARRSKSLGVLREHDADPLMGQSPSDTSRDGERKTVTALFADI